MTKQGAAGGLLAAFLASCTASPSPPPGFHWPVHSLSGGPQAQVSGVLESVDGCVYLAVEGGPLYLVVWPAGSALREGATDLEVRLGETTLPFGQPVTLTGGEYDEALPEEARAAQDTPCQGPPYWVAVGD